VSAARERWNAVFVAFYAGPLLLARAGIAEGSTGGAETQIFLLARELARRGHRVAIAAFDVSPSLPPEVDGVDVLALPALPDGSSRIGRVAWQLRLLRALVRINGDILIQRGAGSVTGVVALAAALRRRPFVFSSASMFDFDLARLVSRPGRALFWLGRRLARTIVVQTDEQAAAARTRWGRTTTVIRSLAESAPLRREPPSAFLWIGRLAPYKQPDAYIELAERLPDVAFQLVATESVLDPVGLERLMSRASRLANLEILGPRSREELAPLYDGAVAVVNTSELEGMSNVFLEAWARGVPALALAYDPDGLLAQRGLGWFAGGSVERLAELAQAAWDARLDQAEIAARCRAHIASEHEPAAVAARWERVLGLGHDF
jgi:glycosyltransferase involved in cell wall biosynthesis